MTVLLRTTGQRWLKCQNQGTVEIPSYGAMRVVDYLQDETTGNQIVLIVDAPNASDGQSIFFNGRKRIGENGGRGACTKDFPLLAAVAVSPANGDRFDVQDGQFALTENGSGRYVVMANALAGPNGETVALLDNLGGGGCEDRNEIHQITIFGTPTGGTFELDYVVNSVTGTLTFNFDDTASEVKTAMEAHAQIAVGDVTVSGGPLPDATIQIEFVVNLAATAVPLPVGDWSALTGGTGVAAIVSRSQSGHPN